MLQADAAKAALGCPDFHLNTVDLQHDQSQLYIFCTTLNHH